MGERPNNCFHLVASEEAYRMDAVTGETTPHTVWLCGYADNCPERLVGMPRWLLDQALAGGPTFDHRKHCAGCPAYMPALPTTGKGGA